MSSPSSLGKRRKSRLHLGMANMRERIRTLRERAGISQGKFGDLFGVTREAVSQWEAGKSRPDQNKLQIMAEKYGVTLDWLAGKGPEGTKPQGDAKPGDNNQRTVEGSGESGRVSVVPGGEALFQGPRDLPILGHVKGGDGAWFIDQGVRLGVTMRPQMLDKNRDAYAVRVHDVSMSRALEPGWVLFVDPHRPTKPGDYVVIQLADGQSFIKRLVRRTDRAVICEQFNPEAQIEYKPAKVKAIHLVVLISPFEP